MEKPRILVIEDHLDTRTLLEKTLSHEFEVICAENGIIGIDFARTKSPDLIIMDIILPILNGLDSCSLLRKDERTKRIPIIFLSAKNTPQDVVIGLNAGADDYVPKPFDIKELIARIKVRLRKEVQSFAPPVQIGELKIDPATREVSFNGKRAHLTLTEFDLLRFLAARAGSIVSRDEIMKEVWRDEKSQSNDRTIDVHVRALRRKIPALTKHIISIYGVGYKYEK